MNAPIISGEIIENVLMKGDLGKLTPEERTEYYLKLCDSLGLNPLTRPMEYIVLNGKLTLYAKRDAADQLRRIHSVSLEIISREIEDGILIVHARAKLPDGRIDEDFGAVAFPEMLKGEARANAVLKGITKAKRRVTLSICGLGFLLDETEIADIPARAKAPPMPARNVMIPAHDAETGEIDPAADDRTAAEWDVELGEAAKEGTVALQDVWLAVPAEHKPTLKTALDKRHKITAANVDAERAPV